MFESMQSFFESGWGIAAVITVIVLIFILVLVTPDKNGKAKKMDVKSMVLSAMFVAIFTVLNSITVYRMPQGGSVNPCAMLAIVLCAYFLGPKCGIAAGIAAGLLDLMINPYVIHPIQLLLDYPLAFGALGFSGFIFSKDKSRKRLIPGYLFGVLCRYICSVLSGIIFFGSAAPEGFNALTWSLLYNITYMGMEAAVTVIILAVPQVSKGFENLARRIAQA